MEDDVQDCSNGGEELEPVLAHDNGEVICLICDETVEVEIEGEECTHEDCPRVAVEALRKAAQDTPFRLGL